MTAFTPEGMTAPLPLIRTFAALRLAPRSRRRLSSLVLFAADLAAAFAAWRIAQAIGAPDPAGLAAHTPPGRLPVQWIAYAAACFAYMLGKGRYTRRASSGDELGVLVRAASLLLLFGLFRSVDTRDPAAGLSLVVVATLFCLLAATGRALAKLALSRAHVWQIPVAILGTGRTADEAELALSADATLGYEVVGRMPELLPLQETSHPLSAMLRRLDAERVVIAVDDDTGLQRRLIGLALFEGIPFSVVPPVGAMAALRSRPTRFVGRDIVMHCAEHGLRQRAARLGKRAGDIGGAAILLVLSSPLFLILIVLARLDGGPAFFSQHRVGAGGRLFRCLKFRTMVMGADFVLECLLAEDPERAAEWAATRKLRNDPRVTPTGRFLRRSSLDELPQLINILRGEMSLIGPRPIAESELPLYGADSASYFAQRPGLSGIWQVTGRSDTSYERRVQLDGWYVRNWSLRNDLALAIRTIPAVLRRDGAC